MNLKEIKRAVDEGLTVCWGTAGYHVTRSPHDSKYFIESKATNHLIGLTWADGLTLNGQEEEFFIEDHS